jgi:hypothetical protein
MVMYPVKNSKDDAEIIVAVPVLLIFEEHPRINLMCRKWLHERISQNLASQKET